MTPHPDARIPALSIPATELSLQQNGAAWLHRAGDYRSIVIANKTGVHQTGSLLREKENPRSIWHLQLVAPANTQKLSAAPRLQSVGTLSMQEWRASYKAPASLKNTGRWTTASTLKPEGSPVNGEPRAQIHSVS